MLSALGAAHEFFIAKAERDVELAVALLVEKRIALIQARARKQEQYENDVVRVVG